MTNKKEYSFREIKELLPYGYPFLFIDKAVLIKTGKRIRCLKNVTGSEDYFRGHFKDNPVMPGIILIEAMAQSAYLLNKVSSLYGRLSARSKNPPPYYLARIKDLRFFRPIYPGDQVNIDIEIKIKIKNTELVEAKAYVGRHLACQGELVFAEGR